MTTLSNVIGALYATVLLLAIFAWLVVLPTVGMLYAFGVLS